VEEKVNQHGKYVTKLSLIVCISKLYSLNSLLLLFQTLTCLCDE
jgi:hypothetical protein